MELVYLWVEKYKNIRNQGFNFSPRFEFEYIQDKNELILKKENKDYVSIFPDNINVTAIVGENGSGKSSVLQLLMNKFIDFNYEGSEQIIRFFAIYKYINPNNKKIEFIFSNDDEDK
jgi:ABC-type dipeptide/oligopeptide/nickel transport system ATPase component